MMKHKDKYDTIIMLHNRINEYEYAKEIRAKSIKICQVNDEFGNFIIESCQTLHNKLNKIKHAIQTHKCTIDNADNIINLNRAITSTIDNYILHYSFPPTLTYYTISNKIDALWNEYSKYLSERLLIYDYYLDIAIADAEKEIDGLLE